MDHADNLLDVYYSTALDLVKTAGTLVLHAFRQPKTAILYTKSTNVDLVTETDKAVEELLVSGLSAAFPSHKFIGEESYEGRVSLDTEPTWIIDPVDGTTNFVHRLPMVAISVGLYIDRRPVIGIIFNPILDELYTAIVGRGAYQNGFKIHVSDTTELSKALIVTTIGGFRDTAVLDSFFETTSRLIRDAGIRGQRALGSAAMQLAYVAAGSVDGYVETGIRCWDMAAGGLLITEAGGVMIDPSGQPFDVMSRRLLCAATPELAEQLRKVAVQVPFDRDD